MTNYTVLLKDIRINADVLFAFGACSAACEEFDTLFKKGLLINVTNWNRMVKLTVAKKWDWDHPSWILFAMPREIIKTHAYRIEADIDDKHRGMPWEKRFQLTSIELLKMLRPYLNSPAIDFFTKKDLALVRKKGGF